MADEEKLSVRERFIRSIEDKILSGQYQIGQKLPSARELCSQMGISLTVVNAGISELASKGFVEVKPRQGTFVADYKLHGTTEALVAKLRYNGGAISSHDIISYTESRAAIDSFVAGLVVERASQEQLEQLGQRLERLCAAESIEECCDRITDFFNLMYFISDNSFLALIYNSTIKPQKEMYAMYMRKNGTEFVKLSAVRVYAHLCSRDAEAAGAELRFAMGHAVKGETAII